MHMDYITLFYNDFIGYQRTSADGTKLIHLGLLIRGFRVRVPGRVTGAKVRADWIFEA